MAKDPAFLFYSDNFQSGTQFFTDEQVGKYIRLLCAQHLHGHLTEKQVLFICKTKGQDTDEILTKFAKDENGLYYNKRLQIEIEKRASFTLSRANNRLGKTKKHLKKKSKTYVPHMEDGDGNENGIENKDVNEVLLPFTSESFLSAWEKWKQFKREQHRFTYKGKHSEQMALNELSKLSGKVESNALEIIEQSIANGWKGLFELKKKAVPVNTKVHLLSDGTPNEY